MATTIDDSKDDKDAMIENNDTAKEEEDFETESTSKDRYGFFVSDKFHRCSNISMETSKSRKMVEFRRSKKWVKMMTKWQKYTDGPKCAKMKSRVRKGIPDDMRGFAWHHFAHTEAIEEKYPDPHKIDTSVLSEIVKDEIERDIDRTFPSHVIFAQSDGSGQNALRNLLRWYASLDPEAGYCQGMGFVAGLFLTYMIEEEAFFTFYSILTRPSAPLRLMYLPKLAETQKVLYIFEHLGKIHLGRLWAHLETEGIHPTMYFIEWAMTMFCRGFSFELVTRVWDIFLFEGDYKIVYRVSLAILKNFEKDMMGMKFEKILPFMREFPTCMDAEKVMDLCWTIPLRRDEIARIESEYLTRQKK